MNGWASIAERQYGVITREQLRNCGLSDRQVDRMVATARLAPMHPAVFRVVGSYQSARQRAAAAALWCGDEAALSYSTAAALLRLPVPPSETIHVSVPVSVRRTAAGICVHRTEIPDRIVVDNLPCTSPARTMVDLAATVNGEELEHLFESARRHGLITKTVFERRVAPLLVRGRPGVAAIHDLMRVVAARPKESRLEVRAHRLLRENRLVPDTLQHRVAGYRIDFAWQRKLVGVECDGFEWHGNRLAWKRDRRRVGALEAQGWRLMHLTWDDVTERPAETLQRIRHALA